MGKYFAGPRLGARAAIALTALSVGCSGTGGERPPEGTIATGTGTSSSPSWTTAASSTSSTTTYASSTSSSTVTGPSDAGLGSDSYFGLDDGSYNAVCLLDTVAFDMSYFVPDLGALSVTTAFADAWDSEVGDPVPDSHTPVAAIDFFGLAAGPTMMSIGAVMVDSGGNFGFNAQPSLVLMNTPVTWSSNTPQHIVMTATTTPFALLVGQPGNVRQITITGASGEFIVDTTCTKLSGDILLTIPSSAGSVAFGGSTIGALLGSPTYISTPGAGSPDAWQIPLSTSRGFAPPIPNFGN